PALKALDDEFDACVIGSGAGGGPAAYALTRAGFEVALLERGPRYDRGDFVHDEIDICRRNFWTPDPALDPHVVVENGKAERSSFGWIAHCLGGGTVPMTGFFFRMRPDEFRQRSRLGIISDASPADWPIRGEELDRYYDEVERVLGLSGDAS